MKISELKTGQGKVDIELMIKSKSDVRVMNKYGKELKVANAIGSDDSGEIKITLWNDDADKVMMGSRIKITNGYVSEFNGEKQLTSGKFGKLEVVNGSGSSDDSSEGDSEMPKAGKSDKAKRPVKVEAEKKEEEEENFDDVTF